MFRSSVFKKPYYLITSVIIILIGFGIIAFAYSPIINEPQCTTEQIAQDDGSNCITGANIGAGMIVMAGMTVAFLGWLSLNFYVLRTIFANRGSFLKSLFTATFLIVGWIIVITLSIAPYR